MSQPGDNSPLSIEDSKENLSGFERASQEIEKASQKQSPEPKLAERSALTELRSYAKHAVGASSCESKAAWQASYRYSLFSNFW